MFEFLSVLFIAIVRLSYAPKELNKGIIVTLFKGVTNVRMIPIIIAPLRYPLSSLRS